MRITLTAFLLFAACFRAPSPPIAAGVQLSEFQRTTSVSVYLSCYSAKGVEHSAGSGIIAGYNEVITAAHVVECEGLGILHIQLQDGTLHQAAALVVLRREDLATLTTPKLLPYQSFAWAQKIPEVGEVLCQESRHPLKTRACGKVVGVQSRRDANILHTLSTIPGNSGSGTWNRAGVLVGITTERTRAGGASSSLAGMRRCLLELKCK